MAKSSRLRFKGLGLRTCQGSRVRAVHGVWEGNPLNRSPFRTIQILPMCSLGNTPAFESSCMGEGTSCTRLAASSLPNVSPPSRPRSQNLSSLLRHSIVQRRGFAEKQHDKTMDILISFWRKTIVQSLGTLRIMHMYLP